MRVCWIPAKKAEVAALGAGIPWQAVGWRGADGSCYLEGVPGLRRGVWDESGMVEGACRQQRGWLREHRLGRR